MRLGAASKKRKKTTRRRTPNRTRGWRRLRVVNRFSLLGQRLGLGVSPGDAVADLLDLPIALYYAAPPDSPLRHALKTPRLEFIGGPLAEGYYAIALNRKNEALAREVDAALERLLRTGELRQIYERWGLWNEAQKKLWAPEAADGTAEPGGAESPDRAPGAGDSRPRASGTSSSGTRRP